MNAVLQKVTTLTKYTVLRSHRITSTAMSTLKDPPVHDMIKPLSWLLGKWKSEEATGIYPTIKTFQYDDLIEFSHVGQPMINVSAHSSIDGKPMHREEGFLRFQPNTSNVAYIISHNFGITEMSEGEITDCSIHFESRTISGMSFGSEPRVIKIVRDFKLMDTDTLEQTVLMETTKTPLTKHLYIKYKKQ
ncbi:peroxynitrite isomerase THAP4-like [Glandiceps talaboti]